MMQNARIAGFGALAALLLAGCVSEEPQEAPQGAAPAAAEPVAAAPTAEPPMQKVALERAQSLFQQICLDHAPTFNRSKAAAKGLGMSKSPRTGILFHPTLNLSVAVWPKERGTCSMVFTSDAGARRLERALAPSSDERPDGLRTTFTSYTEPDGTRYFRAVIED